MLLLSDRSENVHNSGPLVLNVDDYNKNNNNNESSMNKIFLPVSTVTELRFAARPQTTLTGRNALTHWGNSSTTVQLDGRIDSERQSVKLRRHANP